VNRSLTVTTQHDDDDNGRGLAARGRLGCRYGRRSGLNVISDRRVGRLPARPVDVGLLTSETARSSADRPPSSVTRPRPARCPPPSTVGRTVTTNRNETGRFGTRGLDIRNDLEWETSGRLYNSFYRSTLCVSAVFDVVRCLSVCHVGGLYPHG